MRILNMMLGRGAGGIEQAALDYTRCLQRQGQDVLSIARGGSWFEAALKKENLPVYNFNPLGNWDIFTPPLLRYKAPLNTADHIICHGNKAALMGLRAFKGMMPVWGVAHNYHFKYGHKVDHLLSITTHLKNTLVATGIPATRIHVMPNMIDCAALTYQAPSPHSPPVIGAFGRFVAKKGFDDYLQALAILKKQGHLFTALLGGAGPLEKKLRAQITHLGLNDRVRYTGWVTDKAAFFQNINLFCLPSRDEPFGIILLEALAAGIPVVTTMTAGPTEIIQDKEALLTPADDPEKLAVSLQTCLQDPHAATAMAQKGFALVQFRYTLEAAGQRLCQYLNGK